MSSFSVSANHSNPTLESEVPTAPWLEHNRGNFSATQNTSEQPADMGAQQALDILKFEYGVLPSQHILSTHVQNRLAQLLYDIPEESRPAIYVLANHALGANAMAIPAGKNGAIVITPEILGSLRTVEQLDALLLHEFKHLSEKHVERLDLKAALSPYAIAEFFGLRRLGEHQADVGGFTMMCDPKRDTTPAGMISLLNLFKNDDQTAWDCDHGTVMNRLQVLTGMVSALELNPTANPLQHILFQAERPLPKFMETEVARLPQSQGELSAVLNALGNGGSIDEHWEKKTTKYLKDAPLELLEITLPKLCEDALRLKGMPARRTASGISATGDMISRLERIVSAVARHYQELLAPLEKEERACRGLLLSLRCSPIPLLHQGDSIEPLKYFVPLWKEGLAAIRHSPKLLQSIIQRIALSTEEPANSDLLRLVCLGHVLAGSQQLFDPKGRIDKSILNSAFTDVHRLTLDANFAFAVGVGLGLADSGSSEKQISSALQATNIRFKNGNLANDGMPHPVYEMIGNWPDRSTGEAIRDRAVAVAACLQESTPLKPNLRGRLQTADVGSEEFNSALAELGDSMDLDLTNTMHEHADTLLRSGTRGDIERAVKIKQKLVDSSQGYIVLVLDFESCHLWDAVLPVTQKEATPQQLALLAEFSPTAFPRVKTTPVLKNAYENVITDLGRISLSNYCLTPDASLDAVVERLHLLATLTRPDYLSKNSAQVSDNRSMTTIRDFCVKEFLKLPELDRSARGLWAVTLVEPDPILRDRMQRHLYDELAVKADGFQQLLSLSSGRLLPSQFPFLDRAAKTPQQLDELSALAEATLRSGQGGVAQWIGAAVGIEAWANRKQLSSHDWLKMGLGSRKDDRLISVEVGRASAALHLNIITGEINKILYCSTIEEAERKSSLATNWNLLNMSGGELAINPAARMRSSLYAAGSETRMGMIRELLTGSQGLLNSEDGKDEIAKLLIEEGLDTVDEETKRTFQEIATALCRSAPAEDLSLLLCLVLDAHFFRPPPVSANWHDIARGLACELVVEQKIGPEWITTPKPDQVLDPDAQSEKMDALYLAATLPEPQREKLLRDNFGSFGKELLLGLTNPAQFVERWEPAFQDPEGVRRALQNIIEDKGEDYIDYDEDREVLPGELTMALAASLILPKIESFLTGGVDSKKDGAVENETSPLMRLIPLEPIAPGHALPPVRLAVEAGKGMGAPGVRLLQLIGQFYTLPADFQQEFDLVYDSVQGQSKLSAWHTIKKYLPEYAAQIAIPGDRLGGGSLYSVFHVTLKDGSEEACRVMNPNAGYRTKRVGEVLNNAARALERTSPHYANAAALVDLVQRWITAELEDPSFEKLDPIFRETWQGAFEDGSGNAIIVPTITATGTSAIRREQYIKGESLGSVLRAGGKDSRATAEIIMQQYGAQLTTPLRGVDERPIVVHSDVTIGNFLRVRPSGVAILDRGNYLRFEQQDIAKLMAISMGGNADQQAQELANLIEQHPENKDVNLSAAKHKELVAALSATLSEKDRLTLPDRVLFQVHSHGLKVPLEYALLARNMKVLHSWQ